MFFKKNSLAKFFINFINTLLMPLINVLLVLIVVGVILWLINTYIPMDRKIKNILNIVAVVIVIIWLLRALGLMDSLNSIRI